jgi:hypothetical protein
MPADTHKPSPDGRSDGSAKARIFDVHLTCFGRAEGLTLLGAGAT